MNTKDRVKSENSMMIPVYIRNSRPSKIKPTNNHIKSSHRHQLKHVTIPLGNVVTVQTSFKDLGFLLLFWFWFCFLCFAKPGEETVQGKSKQQLPTSAITFASPPNATLGPSLCSSATQTSSDWTLPTLLSNQWN